MWQPVCAAVAVVASPLAQAMPTGRLTGETDTATAGTCRPWGKAASARAEVEAVVEVKVAVVNKEEEEMVATEPPMLEDLVREL